MNSQAELLGVLNPMELNKWEALKQEKQRPLFIGIDTLKKTIFSYLDAEKFFGRDGWVSTSCALPPEFELVNIRTSFMGKVRFGWRQGIHRWTNARGEFSIDNTYWKRTPIDPFHYHGDL